MRPRVGKPRHTRAVRVNIRGLFAALSSAVVRGVAKDWVGVVKAAADATGTLSLETSPNKLIARLLCRSLTAACCRLVAEKVDIFAFREGDVAQLSADIDQKLERVTVRLDRRMLEDPSSIGLVGTVQKYLAAWLRSCGLAYGEAQQASSRLPRLFVDALEEEWRSSGATYRPILEIFSTPFSDASQRQRLWAEQSDRLTADRRQSFGEVVTYAPPLACFSPMHDMSSPSAGDVDAPVPFALHPVLHHWLSNPRPNDAIRAVVGRPMQGKSSFATVFADESASLGINVVLIAAHQVRYQSGHLVETCLEQCLLQSESVPNGVLSLRSCDGPLLIIVDSLEELNGTTPASDECLAHFLLALRDLCESRQPAGRSSIRAIVTARTIAAPVVRRIVGPEKTFVLCAPTRGDRAGPPASTPTVDALCHRPYAGRRHGRFSLIDDSTARVALGEVAIQLWHHGGPISIRELAEHARGVGADSLKVIGNGDISQGILWLARSFDFQFVCNGSGTGGSLDVASKDVLDRLVACRVLQTFLSDPRFDEDADLGELLRQWVRLIGPAEFDGDILRNLSEIIRSNERSDIRSMQARACRLIERSVRRALQTRPSAGSSSVADSDHPSKTADLALLAVASVCGREACALSKIEWPDRSAAARWLAGLRLLAGITDPFSVKGLQYLDLSGCVLNLQNFYGSDLSNADLTAAELIEANLGHATLRGATLRDAILCGARLVNADLTGADLRNVILCGSDLEGADFGRANLSGANLDGARLDHARFEGAVLDGVKGFPPRLVAAQRP